MSLQGLKVGRTANRSSKLELEGGSEYNSASTTTLVKSTRSTQHFFWYRKWPSEASNPQNFPLRGLNEGCALSGARKTFIDLGGGAPKTSIFDALFYPLWEGLDP